MDNTLSEIVLVVDESGSMYSLRSTVISSINTFITQQKEAKSNGHVTLYTFADEVKTALLACDLQEVTPLSEKNYAPDGCTALLDAIGTAIDETGKRLAAMPEEKRPGTVVVGIMTDGYENASSHYTWKQVAESIRHQKEKYSWNFMFFGADENAIATAAKMNIDTADSAVWNAADAAEVETVMTSQHRRICARLRLNRGEASAEDCMVLSSSLSDVMEDTRRRKRRK